MLSLLGLLGALFAGVVADATIATPPESDEDTADVPFDEHDPEIEHGNIFSMLSGEADPAPHDAALIMSNDAATEPDVDLEIGGDAANNIVAGEGGNDTLLGKEGGDMLDGRDGNDSLAGGTGDDGLHGGDDDDTLAGDAGDDTLHGAAGADLLLGGIGNDQLHGCEDDDTLFGDAGDDSLVGGEGNDLLNGDQGDDALNGGSGDDTLLGGIGADTLDGGSGNDTLWGDPEQGDTSVDFVNGGTGDDTLHLGAGDYGHGGDGSDSFELQDIGATDALSQIVDFHPSEDQLIVLYDPATHPNPKLSSLTMGDDTALLLDGIAVANLQGISTLDLSTILLRAA